MFHSWELRRNLFFTQVLDQFNKIHPKIQFTIELEKNGTISFLDLQLTRQEDDQILNNWYIKPTSSGRTINYYSNQPTHQKIAIVYNLVDRAIQLSHTDYHLENLDKVHKILSQNEYPNFFATKHINNRLHTLKRKQSHEDDPTNAANNKKRPRHRGIPTTIPFVSKEFYGSLRHTLYDFKIETVPKSHTKLDRVIKRGKDPLTKLETCHAVYKIKCKDCPATYVGESKRALAERIKEHKNNIKLEPSKHSVVSIHKLLNPTHDFDWTDPEILETEKDYY